MSGFESRSRPTAPSPRPPGIDWLCVSPKAGATLLAKSGDELKLVFPQTGAEPRAFRSPRLR